MIQKLLNVSHLHLKIKDQVIINELSLKIEKGERIGITGPSGCGKSSLITSILAKNPAHNLVFKTFDIDKKATLSYIPQSGGLMPWYSLNKIFNLFNKCDILLEEILEKFSLEKVRNSFPNSLSGGEYQRALLALALINKPDIYIADEPLTQLDISSKYLLMEFWSRQIALENAALLMVSHDLETLLYLCDKILVLSDKPAEIIKKVELTDAHPRSIDFLLSDSYIKSKSAIIHGDRQA